MEINEVLLSYSIICMETGIALLALVTLVPIFLWRRGHRNTTSWKYLLAGALGFLITVRVLELGVHMVCIVMDNPVSRFINGHTWAYVLYGTVMAGVFEEVGRWVILGKLMKKNKTPQNAVFYGLGHGGIEVWAVTILGFAQLLVIALSIQGQGMEAALAALGVTPELETAFQPTLNASVTFDGGVVFANLFERAVCVALHTALTVIVFYGLQKGGKKYLLFSVLGHMAADVMAALYQRGAVDVLWVELWMLACTAALAVWAVRLYREMTTAAPVE